MGANHHVHNPQPRRGKQATVAALLTTGATAWTTVATVIAAQGAGGIHLNPITFAVLCCWLLAAALLATILGLVVNSGAHLMDMWILGVQLSPPDLDAILNRKRDWRARPAVRWISSHTGVAAWVLAADYTWSILGGAFPTPTTVQIMTLGTLIAAGVATSIVCVVGRTQADAAKALDMACQGRQEIQATHGDPAAAAARYEAETRTQGGATTAPRLHVVDHGDRPGRASGE